MPFSRASDARPLARRVSDLAATAWAIASLAPFFIVAAGFALVVVPAVFFGIWCLEALHFLKLID
jgi:hypothetical protein